jgi:hypothetical protein
LFSFANILCVNVYPSIFTALYRYSSLPLFCKFNFIVFSLCCCHSSPTTMILSVKTIDCFDDILANFITSLISYSKLTKSVNSGQLHTYLELNLNKFLICSCLNYKYFLSKFLSICKNYSKSINKRDLIDLDKMNWGSNINYSRTESFSLYVIGLIIG